MGQFSILNLKGECSRFQSTPAFYEDFNLDQIFKTISEKWGEDISDFYSYFPVSLDASNYRREVLADLQKSELYDVVLAFVRALDHYQEICERKSKVRDDRQIAIWHIREVRSYCECLEQLRDSLSEIQLTSRGFQEFKKLLDEYMSGEQYRNLHDTSAKVFEELDSYRVRIEYHNNRVYVSEAMKTDTYKQFLAECFPETEPTYIKNPFVNSVELLEFEEEVLSKFMKKHKNFLKEASKFYESNKEYVNDTFLQFRKEVVFYLSFITFERYMQNYHYDFCAPVLVEEKEFKADGLYDLALACVNVNEMKDVIRNDAFYAKEEQFFVLTGPNQGGKTTFARSLGQLVFFSKMGLDVPAVSAKLMYFEQILSHFSVEESVETGRGKLKEELIRLQPMMHMSPDHSFVVINELFTTAANYDAGIMGNRVLDHFLHKNSMGIYVTHLIELAAERPGIVSLVAMRDENGVRSFKMERSEPKQQANAVTQVKKYQLTYEEIMERLS